MTDKKAEPAKSDTAAADKARAADARGAKADVKTTEGKAGARAAPVATAPATGTAPAPSGFKSVRGFAKDAGPIPAEGEDVHADHADAVEAKKGVERAEADRRAARKKQRAKIKSGHLPGEFFFVGGSLVNGTHVAAIDLPNEADKPEERTLTFTLSGGRTIVVQGEEAEDVMEDMGLKPIPRSEADEVKRDDVKGNVRDDGRNLLPEESEASDEGRVASVPAGMHRSSAVGTDAVTERDVAEAHGTNPIPPNPVDTATGSEARAEDRAADEADKEAARATGETAPGDEDAEEVEEEDTDPKTGVKTKRTVRKAKPKGKR